MPDYSLHWTARSSAITKVTKVSMMQLAYPKVVSRTRGPLASSLPLLESVRWHQSQRHINAVGLNPRRKTNLARPGDKPNEQIPVASNMTAVWLKSWSILELEPGNHYHFWGTKKSFQIDYYSRNPITGINSSAVSFVKYFGPFLKWFSSREELKEIN